MDEIRLYVAARPEYRLIGSIPLPDDDMYTLGLDSNIEMLILCFDYYRMSTLVGASSLEKLPEHGLKTEYSRSAAKYRALKKQGESEFLRTMNLELYSQNQSIIERLRNKRRKTKSKSLERAPVEESLRAHEHLRTLFDLWFLKNAPGDIEEVIQKLATRNIKKSVYEYMDRIKNAPDKYDPEMEKNLRKNPTYRARRSEYIRERYSAQYHSVFEFTKGSKHVITVEDFCDRIGCPESHFKMVFRSFQKFLSKHDKSYNVSLGRKNFGNATQRIEKEVILLKQK